MQVAAVAGGLAVTAPPQQQAGLARLAQAVVQASRHRSLQHHAKLAVLQAVRWRRSAIQALPLPDCLKRYLADSRC